VKHAISYADWAIGKDQLLVQQRVLQEAYNEVARGDGLIDTEIQERLAEELYGYLQVGEKAISDWEHRDVFAKTLLGKAKVWLYTWATKGRYGDTAKKAKA